MFPKQVGELFLSLVSQEILVAKSFYSENLLSYNTYKECMENNPNGIIMIENQVGGSTHFNHCISMNHINRLEGINIDTNLYKFTPIESGDCVSVFLKLIKYIHLSKLRRIKGTNTFTAYTYHYSEESLGETLQQYLENI